MESSSAHAPNPLIEPLTRRELAILKRLAEDLSNQEIAQAETLALSSVKWYVQQIYAKLGVNSRLKAVARAKALGLLGEEAPAPPASPAAYSRPQHNLPAQLTSFIGRQKEIAAASRLVSENRLVTLTGSGGAGKTRLALQVGMELREGFPHGAWFVDLTPLADPALLSGTILAALGVRGVGGDPAMLEMRGISAERLALDQFLERKTLLLIFDNCEHLVEACARLADELLRACPGLKLLATSREALGVPGEKTYPVPSLSLPDPQQLSHLEALAQSEAVRLFVERAQAADGRFALAEGNAAAVAQICRRLDGIPLAIELAAARVKVMSAGQIAGRMDDVFRLLTAGSRTALPRHQTLRAAIEWSYNLLSEPEKAVFRRLAVFRGGWSLEAAEAVCAGEGIDPFDALVLLGRLVEKSLAIKDEQGGQARFRMLEMIRQYAELQLYASEGEVEQARDRHLDWFLGLAETAAPRLRTGEQIAWVNRLEMEHDNLRAALRWALEGKHGEEALRLVGALWYFWQIHNHEQEGRNWMKGALDLADQDLRFHQSLWWARTVVGNVELSAQEDYPSLHGSLEDALEIFRRENDLSSEGQALRLLALIEFFQNRLDAAWQRLQESLAVLQEAHDTLMAADTIYWLGWVERFRGDFQAMGAYFRKSLDLQKATGDLYFQIGPMAYVALYFFDQGDLPSAKMLYQEALKISEALGNSANMALSYNCLSLIAWIEGKTDPAKELADKAYQLSEEIGNKFGLRLSSCFLGQAYWYDNQIDAAYAKFIEAIEISRQLKSSGSYKHDLFFLARFSVYRRNADDIRMYFEEAQSFSPAEPAVERLFALGKAYFSRMEKRFSEAKQYYLESLQIMKDTSCVIHIPETLEGLAVLSESSQPEHTARLFGVAQALRERIGYRRAPDQQAEIDTSLRRLRERLATEEFERLWQEGRGMTLEQAMREVGGDGEAI